MTAAAVTAVVLFTALCGMLRARRLRTARDRLSAELDQAHQIGAALAADCKYWIDVAFLTKRHLTSRWRDACLEVDRLHAVRDVVDEGHAAFVLALAEEFEAQDQQSLDLARRVAKLETELEVVRGGATKHAPGDLDALEFEAARDGAMKHAPGSREGLTSTPPHIDDMAFKKAATATYVIYDRRVRARRLPSITAAKELDSGMKKMRK